VLYSQILCICYIFVTLDGKQANEAKQNMLDYSTGNLALVVICLVRCDFVK